MPPTPYQPSPLDTSHVNLPPHVDQLIERLADKIHDVWAAKRMKEGWRFGPARDDEKKEHPCLVPYAELPESEKGYDRDTVRRSIASILMLGYKLTPPEGDATEASAAIDKTYELLKDAEQLKNTSTARLRELWQKRDIKAWALRPECFTLLAERLTARDQPFLAFDVASVGLDFSPHTLRLRQLQALALARTGAPVAAQKILEDLRSQGNQDSETLGILARTHKDLANTATNEAKRNFHLEKAHQHYLTAFESEGKYYTGINAAFVALRLHKRDDAHRIASEVTRLCRDEFEAGKTTGESRYWNLATLGEAALILGHIEEAEKHYREAVAIAGDKTADVSTTRRQAVQILRLLNLEDDRLDNVFNPPQIVVFTGHRVDSDHRETPRFPESACETVKESIKNKLKEWNAGIGYASAASGADILFLEAMHDLKREYHVVLPFEPEMFRRISVSHSTGKSWDDRFDRVMKEAASVTCLGTKSDHENRSIYSYTNEILLGLARLRGQHLSAKVAALAVWDGVSDSLEGGTGDCVKSWEQAGTDVSVISPEPIPAASISVADEPREPGVIHQEVKAALFADVVGYSKLPESEIPIYLEHFMKRVGRLCDVSEHSPEVRNTWGDAFYFVFPTVGDAATFAEELRRIVTETDWRSKGISRTLRIRIALHAGPMFPCLDPVTKQHSYTGSHVSRTARIEPIAEENQIFASEPFAALAAFDKVDYHKFEYAGELPLAKKYGSDKLFVVHPVSSSHR